MHDDGKQNKGEKAYKDQRKKAIDGGIPIPPNFSRVLQRVGNALF